MNSTYPVLATLLASFLLPVAIFPTRAWSQAVTEDALPAVLVTGQRRYSLPLDEPVTTGSRLGLTVRQNPASVAVVPADQFERRGADNSQDALAGVPGVTAASPPGSAGSVFYRGFGSSSLTQMFNGITPQYDAISARPIDSWILDRIEVIGGPSTYLFGAGAVGGSINYITKLAHREGNAAQARVRYGAFNTHDLALGFNRTLHASEGLQNHVRVDLNRMHSDGYVDGQKRNAINVAASLLTDFTKNISHTFALEYQKETVDRPYWGTPVLNPSGGEARIDPATRFKNYNSIDGVYEQKVAWTRSILEYRWNAQTSIRNTLYHYGALRDYRNVETYRYNASNTAVVRSATLLQRHDQGLTGNRLEFNHKAAFAGRASDWSTGLDYSRNSQTRFPLSLSSTVSTVDPINYITESFYSIPGVVQGFSPDRTNRVNTIAAFVENRTQLSDAWSLVTGLRHDQIALEGINHRAASSTNPAYFKNHYSPTTGRIGVVVDLSPNSNLYVQYSTAADPPAGILTTASYSQVRNFDLTKGKQLEVGSKFSLPNGLGNATLAAYTITRKNLAISDPASPSVTIPVGRQSSKGVEAAASLLLSRQFSLQGNFSYTDARYDEFVETVGGVGVSRAGNRPSNIPSTVTNLWLHWSFAPSWQASVDMRHVSKRYANTANTDWNPAYALFGASLSYNANDSSQLMLRVRNLRDKIYAASGGVGSAYLGAPRSFDVTYKHSF
jgi:iron complex outermembrane recepter protein